MKKLTTLLTVTALVATAASAAHAGMAPATGISGSKHDMNVMTGYKGDDFYRVCAFCHTPHNAISGGTVSAPLWNHAPSTVTPNPYKWAAPANLTITINTDPLIGPSRLCMGCHDGVTAVDSHGSAGSFNGGNTPMKSVATATYTDALGGINKRYIDDLTVTHPIGFKWSDAITARNSGTKPEIAPSSSYFLADVTSGGKLTSTSWDTTVRTGNSAPANGYKKISDTLYDGDYFTCASCHDVHNTNNAVNTTAQGGPPDGGTIPNYFLWAPEQGSTICLSCHIK